MAGASKILKTGEILFKLGDTATFMCIVRRGCLKVFLPKGNEEVQLALLKEGAIVGEMAFFDEKPRSASVKAAEGTEVTVISRADFDKLLQQVPKWVVTMMQSLSSRLRTTNEQLQALQASVKNTIQGNPTNGNTAVATNKGKPYQHAINAIRLIMLALAKDGTKDGSMMVVEKAIPLNLIKDILCESEPFYEKILNVLENSHFLVVKNDKQGVSNLMFQNRGLVTHFIDVAAIISQGLTAENPMLSDAAFEILDALLDTIMKSGYETLSINFQDLIKEKGAKSKNIKDWAKGQIEIANLIPSLKTTKNGSEIIFRITLKEHKTLVTNLRIMRQLSESGLA